MPLKAFEEGAATLQRIEREFAAQRESLSAEAARFTTWRRHWSRQQCRIDAMLAQVRQRLSK